MKYMIINTMFMERALLSFTSIKNKHDNRFFGNWNLKVYLSSVEPYLKNFNLTK